MLWLKKLHGICYMPGFPDTNDYDYDRDYDYDHGIHMAWHT
jgi:hypothetical protein